MPSSGESTRAPSQAFLTVWRGGCVFCSLAAEIACGLAVDAAADHVEGVEQYAFRAFADAMDAIPIALAENSGLAPIESLSAVKSRQVSVAPSCRV